MAFSTFEGAGSQEAAGERVRSAQQLQQFGYVHIDPPRALSQRISLSRDQRRHERSYKHPV